MTLGEQIRKGREEKSPQPKKLLCILGWTAAAALLIALVCSLLHTKQLEQTLSAIEEELAVTQARLKRSEALLEKRDAQLEAAKSQPAEDSEASEEEATVYSIHFYDENLEEVFPEANWYNTAAIHTIVVQWTSPTPQSIKMFSTPTGTETMELTELLEIKAPKDGEHIALLSAESLHQDSFMAHVSFELNFGSRVLTDDTYNMIYIPEMPEE